MTVKELILECDIQKVAALHFEMQENPKIDDYQQFLRLHYIFLRDVRKITPIPGDYLVLGNSIPLNDTNEYEVRLYHKSDMKEQFTHVVALEGEWTSFEQLDNAARSHAEEALHLCCLPDHYDMESTVWEKLLGAELFQDNLNHIGFERIAACLIQKMTFWGFSQADFNRGQVHLKSAIEDAIKEMEWLESLPAGEREKHCFSLDYVIRQLSAEFPELSDELGDDNKDWLERARIAMVMAYREYLRYIKRSK